MFLKQSKRFKDGKEHHYWSLVENRRVDGGRKVVQRHVLYLGEINSSQQAAWRKTIDVFETGHDHRRETFALYEYGKAEVLLGKLDEGLSTLDGVLQIISEEEPKDFELIVDIETRMTSVLRELGRMAEADEIDRRMIAVREAMEDVPVSDDLGD